VQIAPLVLRGFGEQHLSNLPAMFDAVLKTLQLFPEIWDLDERTLQLNKAVWPRLWQLMAATCGPAFRVMYPRMLPLMALIPTVVFTRVSKAPHEFYSRTLLELWRSASSGTALPPQPRLDSEEVDSKEDKDEEAAEAVSHLDAVTLRGEPMLQAWFECLQLALSRCVESGATQPSADALLDELLIPVLLKAIGAPAAALDAAYDTLPVTKEQLFASAGRLLAGVERRFSALPDGGAGLWQRLVALQQKLIGNRGSLELGPPLLATLLQAISAERTRLQDRRDVATANSDAFAVAMARVFTEGMRVAAAADTPAGGLPSLLKMSATALQTQAAVPESAKTHAAEIEASITKVLTGTTSEAAFAAAAELLLRWHSAAGSEPAWAVIFGSLRTGNAGEGWRTAALCDQLAANPPRTRSTDFQVRGARIATTHA
jgi:hypothetical protein